MSLETDTISWAVGLWWLVPLILANRKQRQVDL